LKHVRKSLSEKIAKVHLLQDNTANRFINEHLQLLEFLADHLRSSRVEFHVETDHRCFSAHPESALENLVGARRADLWILYLSTHAMQQWFRDRRIPCIVYGSSYPDMNHIFVDEDWLATSTHAAGMFLAKGHRHLAILERTNPRPGDRKCMAGFRRGLKASRHKNILLHVARHDETAHGICRAVASLLNRKVPPTGWLITNAQVYLTVLSFLASRRIRVGADISLICCRSDVYLDCIIPSVAHYRRNVYSMNQRLLKLASLILKGVPPVRREWHVLSKYCTGDSLQAPPDVRPSPYPKGTRLQRHRS
jgi:LacI family transcriptional regulator